MQVFIYKQGDKKEVAKEGLPHLLNKKFFVFFFVTADTPDTSTNEKEIKHIFPTSMVKFSKRQMQKILIFCFVI